MTANRAFEENAINKKSISHSYYYAIIGIVASFSTMAYFPVIEILGHISVNTSPTLYVLYNYAVFGISIITSAYCVIVVYKGKVSKRTIYGIGLVLLVVLLYFIYNLFYEEDYNFFLYFFLWAIPAVLVGLYVPIVNNKATLKVLELVAAIMGIACILASRNYLSVGVSHLNTLSFGGTNYQGLSYTASLCVGLELFYVFIASENHRFRFFCSKIGKIFEVLLGIGAAFSVFVSGGRGGLLLLVLNVFLFLILLKTKNKYGKRGNRIIQILLIILIIVFGIMLVRQFSGNTLISDSVDRLMSYLIPSSGSAVWNSGRSTIYADSIDLIKRNPFLGYGFFNVGALKGEPYPHNIILETWINAGLIYMILWVVIIIYVWKLCIVLYRVSIDNGWALFLLAYATVFLSVSGTYLWCSELWFVIGLWLSGQSRSALAKNKFN